MSPLAQTQSQQSSPCLPGTWRLEGQRALTLRPREDGVLRIARGQVWVTFDGPHAGPANDQGDQVLGAGEQVLVSAGRRLVLQSFDGGMPAFFAWDFASRIEAVDVPAAPTVSQSWDELRAAVLMGLRATGRLAAALALLGGRALVPRPGPACRA